jgi:hypothetical protein
LSTLYVMALVAVFVALIALIADAVVSVSRQPHWTLVQRPRLTVVPTVDARQQDMPFVGRERRRAGTAVADEERRIA